VVTPIIKSERSFTSSTSCLSSRHVDPSPCRTNKLTSDHRSEITVWSWKLSFITHEYLRIPKLYNWRHHRHQHPLDDRSRVIHLINFSETILLSPWVHLRHYNALHIIFAISPSPWSHPLRRSSFWGGLGHRLHVGEGRVEMPKHMTRKIAKICKDVTSCRSNKT
jgi:hypothetical protein